LVSCALPCGCRVFPIRATQRCKPLRIQAWADSLLYAKGAFPSMPEALLEESLLKTCRGFTVPSPPIPDDLMALASALVGPMVAELLVLPWKRQHDASHRREWELEDEFFYAQRLVFDELSTDLLRHIGRTQALRKRLFGHRPPPGFSRIDPTSVALASRLDFDALETMIDINIAHASACFRRYHDGLFLPLMRTLGSEAMLTIYGPAFPFEVSPRGASFGGGLEAPRATGGQFGKISPYFQSSSLHLSGWSTVDARDIAYEDYLTSLDYSSSALDLRILADAYTEWSDPDRVSFSYPILTPSISNAVDVANVLIEEASTKPCYVSLFAVSEPLKVRVVGMADPDVYYPASLMQPWLYKVVSSHPCFKLTSHPVDTKDVQRAMDKSSEELLLSGDYTGATNDLHQKFTELIVTALVRLAGLPHSAASLLRKCLFDHRLVETGLDDEIFDGLLSYVAQSRGQFMGSPVSFPFLCLANALLCRCSASGLGGAMESVLLCDVPLLINGDDMLCRCTRAFYDRWVYLGPFIGLLPSIGKTYLSPSFCTINSVIYNQTGSLFSTVGVIRWNLIRPFPFKVSLKTLLGDGRPGSGIGDMCRTFVASLKSLNWDAQMGYDNGDLIWFWRYHRCLVRRLANAITHPCLPSELFGLGLPLQLCSATQTSFRRVPGVQQVQKGLYMRANNKERGVTSMSVLPRVPRGKRLKVVNSRNLTMSSAYMNFLPYGAGASRSSYGARRWLQWLQRTQVFRFVFSNDRISKWDEFMQDLCLHPDRFGEDRVDFFLEPGKLSWA
jgi:hypothetical protein